MMRYGFLAPLVMRLAFYLAHLVGRLADLREPGLSAAPWASPLQAASASARC
jgi:hypothetical protein